MSGTVNHQILLVEKPSGKLGPEHFKMVDAAMPGAQGRRGRCGACAISPLTPPTAPGWHGATYRSAVEANSVMAGGAIAEVASSKAPWTGCRRHPCSATPAGRNLPRVPAKHLTKDAEA